MYGKCLMLLTAVVVLASIAPAATAQFGKPAKLEDVPAVVKNAADRAAPQVKWTLAIEFKEGYKLIGRDAKDRPVQATVRNEGKVDEVRVTVPLDDVPQAVRDAVKNKNPEFKPTRVDGFGYESTKLVYYEFAGKAPDDLKKEIRIKVTADGRKFLTP